MPIFVAPCIGFALGVAFAWLAADELARSHEGAVGTRAFTLVVAFALLVFGPAVAYFVAFEPDWAYAFVVDARRVPSAVDLALVLVAVASLPAGFAAAASRARARRLAGVLALAVPACVVALVALGVASPRLVVYATFAQWQGDFGVQPIAGSPLGYALLWIDGLVVAGAAWTVREVRRLASSGA